MHLFSILLIFILGLSSCEKDLYEPQINSSKIKVENVSLKVSKLILNSNLMKSVSEIRAKQKTHLASGKIVFDSISGIYFDDEKGLKITKDDYESYTFKIIKDGGKLENLIFSKNIQGGYDAYKIKYDFSEEEMKNLSQIEIENSPKLFYELVTNQEGELVLRLFLFTIQFGIITSPRDDGDPNGPNAVLYFDLIFNHVPNSTPGSGGIGNSGTNTGGPGNPSSGNPSSGNPSSGSGSGSGTDTGSGPANGNGNNQGGGGILTSPVNSQISTPCVKLLNKESDVNFKSRLNNLRTTNNYNKHHEVGFFLNVANNPANYVYVEGTDEVPNHLIPPANVLYSSYMHVHFNDFEVCDSGGDFCTPRYSTFMFSPKDVKGFVIDCQLNAETAGISPDDTFGMMISHDATYSLKIESPLNGAGNIDWVKFNKDYLKAVKEMVDKNNRNNNTLQIMFLNFLKTYNLENKIGLYQANFSDKPFEQNKIVNWTKLSLNPTNPNDVVETPCK